MAARPKKNIRWHIAGLLFLATVINYVDRQTLSVLAPEITAELNLSNIEYSNIVQAFLISYASMYIVWGLIIDRFPQNDQRHSRPWRRTRLRALCRR
jgi:ACS family hexuronate transporter-like MFS transporter